MKNSFGVLCSGQLSKSDTLFLDDISNTGFKIVLLVDCSSPQTCFVD